MSEEVKTQPVLAYAAAQQSPWLRKRVIALIVALAIVGLGGLLCWQFMDKFFDSGKTITISTTAFVTSIKSAAKYVVATQTHTVTVERSEAYKAWWVYWGTTLARIKVDECNVQYVVRTEDIKISDFVYDGQRNLLVVTLPKPVLDEAFVDIPSDPSKWSKGSSNAWSRFNRTEVEQVAAQTIRNELLNAARAKGFDEATEAVAIKRLKHVLAQAMGIDDLVVEISFR